MNSDYEGMTLASWMLSIATLNNLRGRGIFTDDQVEAIYDEVLLVLETIQNTSGTHAKGIQAARKLIEGRISHDRATRPD